MKNLASKAEPQSTDFFDLKEKVHRAQVDLNYTLYYPLNEKYTGLYKGTSATDSPNTTMPDPTLGTYESTSETVKPSMWGIVEKCMEDGTLEALREGKLSNQSIRDEIKGSTPNDARKSKTKPRKRPKNKRPKKIRQTVQEAKDAESDEGFFEE